MHVLDGRAGLSSRLLKFSACRSLNLCLAGRSISAALQPLAVIERHLPEIRCLGARRIGVFGSFARGEAREDSDVDVFVEFEDEKRSRMRPRLPQISGRSCRERAAHNPVP